MQIFPKDSKIPDSPRVKFGIDPTAPSMHLGHMVPLRIVKKLAIERNANIVIVFGTFTATMGDPSGQDKTRPMLDREVVEANTTSISRQVERFMRGIPWTEYFNGNVFNGMLARQVMELCSKFTTTRLLSRDAFQKRLADQKPVHLHELMVPLFQAWDSVQLKSQVEIGGEDQLFNFQLTRELQSSEGQEPEVCIMTPIINGTDGRKMSKSLGNCIFFDDKPEDVFGKCMSVPDEVMDQWIPLLTDEPGLLDIRNPMERKKGMSWDITRQIWDADAADDARAHFEDVVQGKQRPQEIVKITASIALEAVMQMRRCSKTQARRLIMDGGVAVNDQRVSSEDMPLAAGMVVKVGKRDFAEIV